jgi:hypothetical protein
MQIKSMKKYDDFEWFKFTTGQRARFDTKTHATLCLNGIGRDITETSIGEQMIIAIKNYMDEKQ